MAINTQPLIDQLNGKFVEVAGGPLNQCTDAVNYHLRMQGKPLILGRNAIDFRTAPGYVFQKNTPDFLPQEGDIAIFDIGTYGDVAVVAKGTTINDLVVFGQNYPVGAPCRLRTMRGYAGMINNRGGFLRLSNALKPVTIVADEVIAGKWGNGSERSRRLTQAGYDFMAVQAEVNRKLN